MDSRTDLSPEAKLRYLFITLKGEALQTIMNLPPTGASYITALRKLRVRYENKAAVLRHYLERFLNPGRAAEDAPSIRRLVDNSALREECVEAQGQG